MQAIFWKRHSRNKSLDAPVSSGIWMLPCAETSSVLFVVLLKCNSEIFVFPIDSYVWRSASTSALFSILCLPFCFDKLTFVSFFFEIESWRCEVTRSLHSWNANSQSPHSRNASSASMRARTKLAFS